MPELSVVVPAFRERESIPALLSALEQALQGLDWEAIVVVDEGLDGTEEFVRARAQENRRVRCLQRIGRRGLASACIEGMLASSAPYLAVIDADLQHDEKLLPELLGAAREGADIVVASRYMEGASTGGLSADRVRLSRLATRLSQVVCQGLSDPMSGYFVLRRPFLDRVVHRIYGRGFKVLLDLVAAARGDVRIVERPYSMRSRQHGESKLSLRVVAEFFMLVLYHLSGRLLPARFFLFGAVGLTGVAVHLAVLWAGFAVLGGGFTASQLAATWAAMTSNFFINNVFTYGDQRLRGRALWRGLLSFYVACGIGAFINLAVAEWLFQQSFAYWIAGLAGAVVAAIWNFFTTASFTWGGSK